MSVDIFLWLVYKPLFSIGLFFLKLEELTINILNSSERGREYADFRNRKELSKYYPDTRKGSPNGSLIHKALWCLSKFFTRRCILFEDASYRLLSKIEEKWDDFPKGKKKRKYDFELSYRKSRNGITYLTRREHREDYVYLEKEEFDLESCVVFGNKQTGMWGFHNPKRKHTRVVFGHPQSGMYNPKKDEWPKYDKNEEQ